MSHLKAKPDINKNSIKLSPRKRPFFEDYEPADSRHPNSKFREKRKNNPYKLAKQREDNNESTFSPKITKKATNKERTIQDLIDWHDKKQGKLVRKRIRGLLDDPECTFSPTVDSKSKRMGSSRSPKKVYDKLYGDAERNQKKRRRKLRDRKKALHNPAIGKKTRKIVEKLEREGSRARMGIFPNGKTENLDFFKVEPGVVDSSLERDGYGDGGSPVQIGGRKRKKGGKGRRRGSGGKNRDKSAGNGAVAGVLPWDSGGEGGLGENSPRGGQKGNRGNKENNGKEKKNGGQGAHNGDHGHHGEHGDHIDHGNHEDHKGGHRRPAVWSPGSLDGPKSIHGHKHAARSKMHHKPPGKRTPVDIRKAEDKNDYVSPYTKEIVARPDIPLDKAIEFSKGLRDGSPDKNSPKKREKSPDQNKGRSRSRGARRPYETSLLPQNSPKKDRTGRSGRNKPGRRKWPKDKKEQQKKPQWVDLTPPDEHLGGYDPNEGRNDPNEGNGGLGDLQEIEPIRPGSEGYGGSDDGLGGLRDHSDDPRDRSGSFGGDSPDRYSDRENSPGSRRRGDWDDDEGTGRSLPRRDDSFPRFGFVGDQDRAGYPNLEKFDSGRFNDPNGQNDHTNGDNDDNGRNNGPNDRDGEGGLGRNHQNPNSGISQNLPGTGGLGGNGGNREPKGRPRYNVFHDSDPENDPNNTLINEHESSPIAPHNSHNNTQDWPEFSLRPERTSLSPDRDQNGPRNGIIQEENSSQEETKPGQSSHQDTPNASNIDNSNLSNPSSVFKHPSEGPRSQEISPAKDNQRTTKDTSRAPNEPQKDSDDILEGERELVEETERYFNHKKEEWIEYIDGPHGTHKTPQTPQTPPNRGQRGAKGEKSSDKGFDETRGPGRSNQTDGSSKETRLVRDEDEGSYKTGYEETDDPLERYQRRRKEAFKKRKNEDFGDSGKNERSGRDGASRKVAKRFDEIEYRVGDQDSQGGASWEDEFEEETMYRKTVITKVFSDVDSPEGRRQVSENGTETENSDLGRFIHLRDSEDFSSNISPRSTRRMIEELREEIRYHLERDLRNEEFEMRRRRQ